MKYKLLSEIFYSTLSCIKKCIRFFYMVISKKIMLGLMLISFLGACSSPSAMLGPAYTLTSTGSGLQAGLNYGSNQLITMYTGKTPIENLQEISSSKEKEEVNFKKKILESEDFYHLVKNKIEKTNKILQTPNQ